MTTREIVEAAEQRYSRAISYHFGSREGLLLAILARRGWPIDRQRAALRAALGASPPVVDLVRCLVEPYCAMLEEPSGRCYLRIVSQLRGRFAAWRVESDAETSRGLTAVLDELEARPQASAAIRRERLAALIMLMTATTSERARAIDEEGAASPELSHQEFVDHLVVMCAALITA